MNTTWSTRAGTGADRHAVHDLVHAAFGRPAEAGLVDALRDDPAWLDGLSLLATDAHGTPVGNDHLAHGALRALYEAGRSVPNDLDVVGFDDIEASPRAVTCHRAACCHSPPGHAVSPVIQPHVRSPVTRPRAVTRHWATRAEASPPGTAHPHRTALPLRRVRCGWCPWGSAGVSPLPLPVRSEHPLPAPQPGLSDDHDGQERAADHLLVGRVQ
ncbi:substrate-binding domain-containing protein [Streptomyces collinus]|uniref:substrate-binding domain-containing protein n=1 Tax=Streptomyces collinus TaxID=42684 RepID=UPI0036E1579C